MPSKAYGKFQNNLTTVQRLIETYKVMKASRGKKGRGAFDHITRSAVVFLVSAFEVYCEDILCEGVTASIVSAGDAIRLPHAVKKNISAYIRNDNNHVPPMALCDEGWRDVYTRMAKEQAKYFNSPKTKNLKEIYEKHLGIPSSAIDALDGIDRLDDIIEFRGEIVHQVKSSAYVHIEDVWEHLQTINEIVIGIDMMVRDHIKNLYHVKVPWNDTYVHMV